MKSTTNVKKLFEEKDNNNFIDNIITDGNINSIINFLQVVKKREERRKTNKKLLASLKRRLGATQTIMWMKKRVSPETCSTVLDDYRFCGSWLQRKVDELGDLIVSCKDKFRCKADEEPSRVNIGSLVNRLRLIGFLFFDLVKETTIFVSLILLVSIFWTPDLFGVMLFPMTITFLLFCSIFPPYWRAP